MFRLAALLLCATSTAALAEDGIESLRGQYGSATDPATSCAANPHQLDFVPNPPHAIFLWDKAWTDRDGQTIRDRRYDLLDHDGATLTLRLEGDSARTAAGGRPIWILRPTAEGYCWGRQDWPVVRCEEHQLRCDRATS